MIEHIIFKYDSLHEKEESEGASKKCMKEARTTVITVKHQCHEPLCQEHAHGMLRSRAASSPSCIFIYSFTANSNPTRQIFFPILFSELLLTSSH